MIKKLLNSLPGRLLGFAPRCGFGGGGFAGGCGGDMCGVLGGAGVLAVKVLTYDINFFLIDVV